jgi:hypothetical protein
MFPRKAIEGLAAAMLACASACSIKPPEVRITGEKTALEMEILGTYSQMCEDTWLAASTRAAENKPETAPPPRAAMSPEKKRSLDALRRQAFNRDDVEEFKREGWVGESNLGTLVVRDSSDLAQRPDRLRFVIDIVGEENLDRGVILERVVELNDALKRAVPREVAAVFSRMYQENSPDRTWIQDPDGKWARK